MKTSKKDHKRQFGFIKTLPKKKYENIEFYVKLRDALMKRYKDHTFIDVEEYAMTHVTDYLRYVNNSTCFSVGDAFMRFGSRGKSIDISRVDVPNDKQGKGLGTAMMNLFFNSMFEVIRNNVDTMSIPDIILECSGQVGFGDTFKHTPRHTQVRFFQKFGFEVVREDIYGYIHMKLSPTKFLEYWEKELQEFKSVSN
jgi:GNAT superfamily N-acetyltransferase